MKVVLLAVIASAMLLSVADEVSAFHVGPRHVGGGCGGARILRQRDGKRGTTAADARERAAGSRRNVVVVGRRRRTTDANRRGDTALRDLLDVPDGFFTVTFAGMGLLLSISKNFVRIRMEEMAWDQRLEEGRKERLRRDPTLTELDLRRKEAAMEWSAYGKPRWEEEEAERARRRQMEEEEEEMRAVGRRGRRVKVMDRDEDDDEDDDEEALRRRYQMTDDEINAFETEYGVDYDPYYDDPYSEDELPEGKFTADRFYGDRVYENGEIFYKDSRTGLFYRQGAKPRTLNFWG